MNAQVFFAVLSSALAGLTAPGSAGAEANGGVVSTSDRPVNSANTFPAARPEEAATPIVLATPDDISILQHSVTLLGSGREIFRFDTFASEKFWGDKLRLH